MRTLPLLLLSALFAAPAAADNTRGFFAGAGFGIIEFDDGSVFDEENEQLDFRVAELIGGYKYNSALGVDLRVGTGFSSETIIDGDESSGLEREYTIDQYTSIYYRPELANEDAKLYGLLGYSRVERSFEATELGNGGGTAADESDKESGASYGVGIGFVINKRFNLNFEYKMLIDKDEYESQIGVINVDYRLPW